MGARIRHVLTETLLWAASVLGLIAIVLVSSAFAFNTSVILFRTGSMEPTVPAGSAALVQEVAAAEVEVGDVLTVDRPDRMPITHRVISIEPGSTADERVITMQGDANDSPDPYPYTITEGRVLLGSVPGIANAVNQMGSPYVLGGVTVAASWLVGWAFWPRSGGGSPPDRPREDSKASSTTSHTPRHAGAVVGIAAVAAAAVVFPAAEPATADTVEQESTDLVHETRTSEVITVTSIYDPATRLGLTPKTVSEWDIGVAVDAPSTGQARAGLSGYGDFPLEVTVLACSEQWSDPPSGGAPEVGQCAGTTHVAAEDVALDTGSEVHWVNAFATDDTPWLRLLVGVPHDGGRSPTGIAGLTVHVHAQDAELSVDTEVAPKVPTDSADTKDQHDDGLIPTDLPTADENLARTGISVGLLLTVALGSVFVGRYLQSRSTRASTAAGGEPL